MNVLVFHDIISGSKVKPFVVYINNTPRAPRRNGLLIDRRVYIVYTRICLYMMNDITTIKLQKSTRDRLAALGMKGQTYDDIILALMDERQKRCESKR